MKKILVLIILSFLSLSMFGCEKTSYYLSRPVGYSLLSDDYAARGSFLFDSSSPYNINEIGLDLFLLPHLWAEIKESQATMIELDNPNFIVFDEMISSTITRRAFVKYILIGETVWTAHLEGGEIVYMNDQGINIIDTLIDEQAIREYIDAIEMSNAYYIDEEQVMLTDFESVYDDGDSIYQLNSSSKIMINYASTNSEMPDLSSHFSDFDAQEINVLYSRVYEKREVAEFKIQVFSKSN